MTGHRRTVPEPQSRCPVPEECFLLDQYQSDLFNYILMVLVNILHFYCYFQLIPKRYNENFVNL